MFFLECTGSRECLHFRKSHTVLHTMVKGTKHPMKEVIFLQTISVHRGETPNHQTPFPLLKCCFCFFSSSQCHKYNCVIVPMSLYVETEITQRGLVSEKKTLQPQTRESLTENRDSRSNTVRLRRNETDKWRPSLWIAMTCALWRYNEDGEDEGRDRVYSDGTHFGLWRLDTSPCAYALNRKKLTTVAQFH